MPLGVKLMLSLWVSFSPVGLLNWSFTGNFITKIAEKQMGKGKAPSIQILALFHVGYVSSNKLLSLHFS